MDACPYAKVLPGGLMCPCHGMVRPPAMPRVARVPRGPKAPRTLRPSPTFAPEQIEEIIFLSDQGATLGELAKKFNCTQKRIHDARGTTPQPRLRIPPLTDEQEEEIRQARERGESVSSLGRRFKRDRWTIYAALGKDREGADCPSTFSFGKETFPCHLRHRTLVHRSTWRDGDGFSYRVEWK